mmetsp:Transcript_34372/g.67627  ORF Transcript_34372/g.67627 Transcript_34372/m.67627 type:complete len:252 (-) Transcript_34372:131-886(-)
MIVHFYSECLDKGNIRSGKKKRRNKTKILPHTFQRNKFPLGVSSIKTMSVALVAFSISCHFRLASSKRIHSDSKVRQHLTEKTAGSTSPVLSSAEAAAHDIILSEKAPHTTAASTNEINSNTANATRIHPESLKECLTLGENAVDGVFCHFLHGMEVGLLGGIFMLLSCVISRMYAGKPGCPGKYYKDVTSYFSSKYSPVPLDDEKYNSDDDSIHLAMSDDSLDMEMVPGRYVPRSLSAFDAYPATKNNSS